MVRNIVLVGFMGAGKSTVGRLLAQQLHLEFVDTDACIEERAGAQISDIFAQYGEAHFRAIEAEVIQEKAQSSGQVIATGGGVLGDQASLRALLACGLVVWLQAPLPRLVERAVQQGNRPLLAGDEATRKAEALYLARTPLYAQSHLVVDADQHPDHVAQIVAGYWRLAQDGGKPLQRIPISLQERSYEVAVGTGLLDSLPELLNVPAKKALLVSDTTVAALYGERVLSALRMAGWQVSLHVVTPGEESKSFDTLRALYTACVEAHLERSSALIALGGGVVGDLTGFAAATFLRGVTFIQVPTTLLAQVDASVGGKVAVNLPEGKNLVGAFYQPRAVVVDVGVLTSLPRRELLSGLAEVIKHGVIADAQLFSYVEEHWAEILACDPDALQMCVGRSCEIKGAVVEADERESAQREVLNFGHTVGHAIEKVSGYGVYAHGEAVAIGMVTAAKLSLPFGFTESDLARLTSLLVRVGLPVNAPQLPIQALLDAMQLDKKVRNGVIRFALASKLGYAEAGISIDAASIMAALEWQNKL